MTRIAGVDYPVNIRKDETIVKRSRLEELERKEQAHDDYLEVIRIMARRVHRLAPKPTPTEMAYRQAILDFSQAVVDTVAARQASGG